MRLTRDFAPLLRSLAIAGLIAAPVFLVAADAPGSAPAAAASATPAFPKPTPATRSRTAPVFRKNAPTTVGDLQAIESRVKALVAEVSPAVVGVQLQEARAGMVNGSGVVISADGLVLTAAHVSGAPNRDVVFLFPDGRTAKGKTLGTDRGMDAGLMRISDPGPWPFVPVGDLELTRLGDWVVSLGHPGGFDSNRPVVARLGRIMMMTRSMMQTDCTLLSGDSGGPLFDISGRVIGIHSGISDAAEENYHVPISTYLDTWTRLANGENWGSPTGGGRGGRGGRGASPGGGLTASAGAGGLRLDSVAEGSRAARLQLQVGDIVVKFNGQPVTTPAAFLDAFASTEETFSITIKRGSQQLDLEYTPNRGGRGGGGRGAAPTPAPDPAPAPALP